MHGWHAGALNSSESWSDPCRTWRKREAYIALMRHVTKPDRHIDRDNKMNYQQWDCFRLADYKSRQALAKTFCERHLPLSNGDHSKFDKHLPNPASWDTGEAEPPKKKVRKDVDGETMSKPKKIRVYNVEKDCFEEI